MRRPARWEVGTAIAAGAGAFLLVCAALPVLTETGAWSATVQSGRFQGSNLTYWWNSDPLDAATLTVNWTMSPSGLFQYATCDSHATSLNWSDPHAWPCPGFHAYGDRAFPAVPYCWCRFDNGTSGGETFEVPAGGTAMFGGGAGWNNTLHLNYTWTFVRPITGWPLGLGAAAAFGAAAFLAVVGWRPRGPKGQGDAANVKAPRDGSTSRTRA